MKSKLQYLLVGGLLLLIASPAFATSLTAQEILQQFNLVVLNNATSGSEVEGRTYVGGNLTGGNYAIHPADTPSSNYAGLTVGGTATGVTTYLGAVVEGNLSGSTVNTGDSAVFGTATNDKFNGSAYVYDDGGSNNFNGGQDSSLATGTTATAATSTDFATVLTDLSGQLKGLSSNSTYSISGNTVTFTATANSNGVAVFDIGSDALTAGQYQFSVGTGVTSIIMNVDASSASISANFLNSSAIDLGSKIIWNFYNASTLSIGTQFGGSILAPSATLTNTQVIEGGVYVDNLQQSAEIHLRPYTGATPTPEPATMMLFGVGLVGLALVGNWVKR